MLRWLVAVLILLLIVFGLIGSIYWLGHESRHHLQSQPRFRISLGEIDCPVPPGLSRKVFLDEVQYYAACPDDFSLLDKEYPKLLKHIFSKHHWVEKVEEVKLQPPRQIQVGLLFRQPVLVVRIGGQSRCVDGYGILLPRNCPTEGLPIFPGKAHLPAGEGMPWGDPAVEGMAKQIRKANRGTSD